MQHKIHTIARIVLLGTMGSCFLNHTCWKV